jgi:RNA polymerase sigma factor (sigma-70 family)
VEELERLVERARAGDLDAFGRIVERFQDMAYGCAYAVVGDFHLAQDAAQEAFLEAYRSLDKLRDAKAFPGWFRRIVLHSCNRLTRRRQPEVVGMETLAGIPSASVEPAKEVAMQEIKDNVLAAVRALPDHERMATTLFYINGYSQEEIAGFLEVPVTTVNNRLHQSREQLRERMMNMVSDALKTHPLPDDFARQMVEKAKQLIREKKPGEAEDVLRQALQVVPNHPEALRQLNRALMWGRVYGLAHWELMPQLAAHGEAILKSGQAGADFFKHFSETLLVIPDMPRAVSFIEGWISQRGPSLEALGKLAWAKGCLGDYPGADSTWDELTGFVKNRPREEIGAHVPLACMALVDCLACAGETERARRVVRGGWDVCRPEGALRYAPGLMPALWPALFKQAGLPEDAVAVAQTCHDALRALPHPDAIMEAEAMCARVWFDDTQAVISEWLQWVRDQPSAKGWQNWPDVIRAFREAGKVHEWRQIADATYELLGRIPGQEAAAARRLVGYNHRYNILPHLEAGDMDTVNRIAEEARTSGTEEGNDRLRMIAVFLGWPSPSEYMKKIADRKKIGTTLDLWGGDAYYHIAREAAAAGDERTAFDALRRACEYWCNPPLWLVNRWEKDTRWGDLRNDLEFKRILDEKRRRIGPIYGGLHYFPGW